MHLTAVKNELDRLLETYYNEAFIENDPVSIPHRFSEHGDIEISAFIAAIFSWGQRVTIINKSNEFLSFMDDSPMDFVLNFKEEDLNPFQNFKHRTFNGDDAIALLYFLKYRFKNFGGLRTFFINDSENTVFNGLSKLSSEFRGLKTTFPRSHKHIADPSRKAACKRINMFLRWMVRNDERGIDFGIWNELNPSQLVIPLDLHVLKSARALGLTKSKQSNWKTAVEITEKLKKIDLQDPVKYDYALFCRSIYS